MYTSVFRVFPWIESNLKLLLGYLGGRLYVLFDYKVIDLPVFTKARNIFLTLFFIYFKIK